MAEKYESRPVTEEDMQRERDEFPYGLFVDGRVHGFFKTQVEADDALGLLKAEADVQQHLKAVVAQVADDWELSEAEVWQMIRDLATESYMMEIL